MKNTEKDQEEWDGSGINPNWDKKETASNIANTLAIVLSLVVGSIVVGYLMGK